MGLKKGTDVISKVATHAFFENEGRTLAFSEIAAKNEKRVELNLDTKVAKVSNFKRKDLKKGAVFICEL